MTERRCLAELTSTLLSDPARVFLLLIAGFSGGCSTLQSQEQVARPTVNPGEFGTSACFFARQALDFEALDDRNLVVFAPSKDNAYHVQISPPAMDLRFANGVAFASRNTQICGYAGDDLLLVNGASQRRYSVIGVYRLDAAALDALRARFGRVPASAPAEPEPEEGAEIERQLGEHPAAS